MNKSSPKSKLAVFLHGWAGSKWSWFRFGSPIQKTFEDQGFTVITPTLPGRYLEEDQDFNWYAKYLAGIIENEMAMNSECRSCPYCQQQITAGERYQKTNSPIEEIVLVGYSMGGVVARHYLQSNIGQPDPKQLVTKLITIASPHRGTSSDLVDLAAEISERIKSALPLPFTSKIIHNISRHLAQVPCYLQIKPDSQFIQDLNRFNLMAAFPNLEFHSIRTRGDKVVTPSISAVVDGAENYLINNSLIGHLAVKSMPQVKRIIADIMRQKAQPSGLQKYPNVNGCRDAKQHYWVPQKQWEKVGDQCVFHFRCLHCQQFATSRN